MKILQVNNVYGEKSTGKLTKQLHEGLLAAGHESLVVYGRGRTFRAPELIRLCPEWYGKLNGLLARITGMPYGGCFWSTSRLIAIIKRKKPDIVHLQCINGTFVNIYRLIRWLKKNQIKTVLSLHAEFMHTGNCGHAFDCDQWKQGCRKCPDIKNANRSFFFDRTAASWKRMRKAFRGFEKDCLICPVSPWTQMRAQQSDILKAFPFETVYNGVDTESVFCRDSNTAPDETNRVLHVTAYFCSDLNHIKGGCHVIELARRLPQIEFVVAGKAEENPDLPKNITLLGKVSDQKVLAEQYRRANLTLIVSKRETFSMPCVESLCCGTPVVGFRAGAPEMITLPQYSEFVEYADIDTLEKILVRWLERTDLNRNVIAQEGERVYSTRVMNENFMKLYRRVLWN